jgi:VCBS repeat-containing protein
LVIRCKIFIKNNLDSSVAALPQNDKLKKEGMMNGNGRNPLAGNALFLIGLSLFLAVGWIAFQTAHAAGIRYAAPAAQGSGNCYSWANACTLSTALGGASSGDEIWAKAGVHYPGGNRTDTFALKSGVAVYGGFAGTETVRTQRDPEANTTILSGDIDRNDTNTDGNFIAETWNDIQGANAYHVVTGSGTDDTAVLDGFTITAGQGFGDPPEHAGGGMYNDNGSPALTGITFIGNWARAGGGMYNDNSSHPNLNTVNFIANSCGDFSDGGGMYNHDSNPSLTNVTFEGNRAGPGYSSGGGMINVQSDPVLTNVTFRDNLAGNFGGGMYSTGSNPVLTGVTFSGNYAASGGGMSNWGGTYSLTNVTFRDNTTGHEGGGLYNTGSTVILTNITFSGNHAASGGGMYNGGGILVITQGLFLANSADIANGGGMIADGGSLTIANVTFSSNSAVTAGGGMANADNSPVLSNLILWGNTAAVNTGIQNFNSTPYISHSDIQGCGGSASWNSACGTDGGGNIEADPLFVDAANGNLRLQDTSPAINTGDNAALPPGILTDLDGKPRFVRLVVDMGAYENQSFPCPAGGVLYVDQDATGAQTGESWTEALVTLQDALQVSEACEIWVAEGVYYPDEGGSKADNDRSASFALKSGVALYGGFAGTETSREQRDWKTNVTILSGDIDGNDTNTDGNFIAETCHDLVGGNSYHVVTGSGTTNTAGLDGFTISAGTALGGYPTGDGGGMLIFQGSPTLANLTFSANSSNAYGGGMCSVGSNLTLTGATFTGNCGYDGGGMFAAGSQVELDHVVFQANSATTGGGGLRMQHSSSKLYNVSFLFNSAGGGGGAIQNLWGDTELVNVVFINNHTSHAGGAIANQTATLILTNTTFYGNYTNTIGGGLYNEPDWRSSVLVQNSIFMNNMAPNGPQIYNENIATTLTVHSSLAEGCNPGGVWNEVCGTNGGGNLPDADPHFVDAANGNLRLTRLSPAIDAGDNAALPPDAFDLDGDGNTSEPLPYDLAGGPRRIDVPDTADTGSGTPPIVDLGAYERGLNRAPVASGAGESYATNEDTPLAVPAPGLLANDSDPDGDPLSAVLSSAPAHGLLALNANGSFSYTPAANYHGPDSFTYVASDGGLSSNTVTVTLTINPVNDLPVISEGASITVNMDEDGASLPFSLTLHATDVDGDTLTWSILTPAAHGAASAGGTGASKAIGYTPAANYNGSDSFAVQVLDGHGGLDSIQVNLAIAAVNDAPLLDKPGDLTINEDAAQQTVNLSGIGDGDMEITQVLAVSAVSSATGIIPNPQVTYTSPNATGTLMFTPVANANGEATITVAVSDNGSGTPPNVNTISKQLIVRVTPVNDPPAGANQTVTTLEDERYSFSLADFGFSDPNDNPANNFSRVKITSLVAQGALKLDDVAVTAGQFVTKAQLTAGSLSFTPAANANGAPYTSFTFQVEDDGGTANGGVNLDPTANMLTIYVTAVNDAPVAAGDSYTTDQNTPLTIPAPGILANDTDVDSSSLTAILVSAPGHGLLSLNPNGAFVYTPELDYHGADSFTYYASDGALDSNIVTVSLTVQQVYRVFLPVVQRNVAP